MELLIVKGEASAAILQQLTRPGVEVVCLSQEVDSNNIVRVTYMTSKEAFSIFQLGDIARMVNNKLAPSAEIRVFLV